jgi:hypothetical protein
LTFLSDPAMVKSRLTDGDAIHSYTGTKTPQEVAVITNIATYILFSKGA